MSQSTFVCDPSVWTAAHYPASRRWVRTLSPDGLGELDAAVASARRAGVAYWRLTPKTFPLPSLAETLSASLRDLEEGPGFAVLGGFPVERYDRAETLLAYAGICSHLGSVTAQTHLGDRVIEVTDLRKPYDHTSRGYHSNKLLPFHTDGADYVGLLCLGVAARGGSSVLASAGAVHDMVLRERPDLYEVLRRGFRHHRRGEEAPGEPPVSIERIPVFAFHDGLLHCMYNRNPIEWVQKEGCRLSACELEALDFLDDVLARPGVALHMDLQVGDIQFVNNLSVLHSRTEFEDDEEHRRRLLRLWISNPAARRRGPTLLDLYNPEAARKARD
ncbi:MAG: TauD/TfdA family dioxygenase [Acidimicrobiales bacterium]